MANLQSVFLSLIRHGIDISNNVDVPSNINWLHIKAIAEQQGLNAIVLDSIESLPEETRPPKVRLLQWISEVLHDESLFSLRNEVSIDVAKLFYKNGIRTYVLKGAVVCECYPKSNHRVSADVDCYLLPEKGDFNAWALGNTLIQAKGFNVNTDFYKNSSFDISGVIIENHQFFTPFRGNKRLEYFERVLQALMQEDKGEDRFADTWLYRPPVMVTALFLIEHAYSHFLHEGLTWRHILDWMMFRRKHENEILWNDFNAYIDEFGFDKFYRSYLQLGKYMMGEISEGDLSKPDKQMLADVWAPLDIHDTVRGLKGKLALVGNTWRARWKYRHFTDMTWLRALWIQVKGFLFIREPKLN